MIKLIEFFCRVIASALILYPAFYAVDLMATKTGLQFSIHGAAWLVLIVFCAIFSLVRAFLTRKYRSAFKTGNGIELSATAADFFVTVTCFVSYAFAFFATAAVVPDLASYSSVALMLLVAVIVGSASAACTLIDKEVRKVFDLSHLNSLT